MFGLPSTSCGVGLITGEIPEGIGSGATGACVIIGLFPSWGAGLFAGEDPNGRGCEGKEEWVTFEGSATWGVGLVTGDGPDACVLFEGAVTSCDAGLFDGENSEGISWEGKGELVVFVGPFSSCGVGVITGDDPGGLGCVLFEGLIISCRPGPIARGDSEGSG